MQMQLVTSSREKAKTGKEVKRVYFDIETYRKEKSDVFKEKIILIGILDEESEDPVFFSEWEKKSEKKILLDFYNHLEKLVEKFNVWLIGYNILDFDIPLVILKMIERRLRKPLEATLLFHEKCALVDYIQISRIFNERMQLMRHEEFAKMLNVNVELHGSGGDVKNWYEQKEFDEIKKHCEADLKVVREIDRRFREIVPLS